MLTYEGRTLGTITIPGKPIPVGFKVFYMAENGYIWNFEFSAPGALENQPIDSILVPIPGTNTSTKLSNTQAMVARLASFLFPFVQQGLSFHFYLDNLFVSWKTYYYLLQQGIALTGTVRKGAAGYPPRLSALKASKTALKWGSIQADIVHNVLCFLWQDNGPVQGMTTGHTATEEIERLRKRPKKFSGNVSVARPAFGDEVTKILPIPRAIDGYNYSMNIVD